jgi:Asp-tRNA(Asn)/Glu-tRNA(Gln) amidotransferase B subunit
MQEKFLELEEKNSKLTEEIRFQRIESERKFKEISKELQDKKLVIFSKDQEIQKLIREISNKDSSHFESLQKSNKKVPRIFLDFSKKNYSTRNSY